MKRVFLLLAVLLGAGGAAAEDAAPASPFESGDGFLPANAIDVHVLEALQAKGIEPSRPCSDGVFIRRVYLDLTGTLPEAPDVRRFLQDSSPDKRMALVDELMEREEFADWWSLKWADLLRVKAEFPINLWPNAVQAYHRWIRDQIRDNTPYDQFARALLTSSGSNFRVPAVNFCRAVQGRTPAAVAAAAALTFMGVRFGTLTEGQRKGMTAFFSRIAYKKTGEWKEEIVMPDPAATAPLEAVFPDGTAVRVPPDADPRRVFADWLLADGNPWFARCIANRVWFWFFGRGIVHEPDDFRPDNPPSSPALLARLEKEVVDARYDLRKVFRFVIASRTYQGSPVPRSAHPEAEALFAHYPVRRLDAEVLIDTLCGLDGSGEDYWSIVPEPFTYVPNRNRTITLADGTITSSFLEMFGRPARDTGLESERTNQPTDAQRLYLLNSTDVQRRLQRSARLRLLVDVASTNSADTARWVWLTFLSRYPTDDELTAAEAYVRASGLPLRDAAFDIAWALLNTKEFLYRH